MAGVLLRLLHPEVATRDCGHCQEFVYDEDSGLPVLFNGEPLPRDGQLPPCRRGKCPKGTPENSVELRPHNWLCYTFYRRCAAVGKFPDDPLIAEHAAIIREAERTAWETKQLNAIRSGLPSESTPTQSGGW